MNLTQSTGFDYRPLNIDKSEVRLIRLLPSRDKTAKVECKLIHASLDDSGKAYDALSYTWDSNILAKSITLNANTFPVTENLEAALRALRKGDEDRYLWVDAICINQADLLERNREVLRMLQIYRNAQRVVVWLGQEIDTTGIAIQHLRDLKRQWDFSKSRRVSPHIFSRLASALSLGGLLLRTALNQLLLAWSDTLVLVLTYISYRCEVFHTGTLSGWLFLAFSSYRALSSLYWFCFGLFHSFYFAAEKQSQASSPDEVTLAALKDFFERKWFTRVWVIQEVAAARDVTVICGSYDLPWETLRHVSWQLSRLTTESWGRSAYTHTGFQRLGHIINSLDLEDKSTTVSGLNGKSLFLLLCMFTISEATEKHDKVYGLLGLADEVQNPVPGVAVIEARYDETPQRAYSVVTKFLIETSGNLRVFRACQGSRALKDLPSWVPDWSTKAWRDTEGMGEPFRLRNEDASMPVAQFSGDLKTVKLRGFIIGHLSGLPVTTTRYDLNGERFMLRLWWKFLFLLTLIKRLSITWYFIGLIFKGVAFMYPEQRANYMEMFEFYRKAHLSDTVPMEVLNGITPDKDGSAVAFHEDAVFKQFDLAPIPEFHVLQLAHCISFLPDVRRGDAVCMVIGADSPLILRKNAEDWTLLGAAHLSFPDKPVWNRCVQKYTEDRLMLQSFIVR